MGVHRRRLPRGGAAGAEKNELRPHLRTTWGIPPKASAEFVAHTGGVPGVYHRPPDPGRPVVCMGETFERLIGEAREPLPPGPGRVGRYDGVYVRNGVASPFLAFEPAAGWREVRATDTRTRADGAGFTRDPVGGRYKAADTVVLGMGRLNAHAVASLYEAFAPAAARRLAERLEVHPTPEHGGWLNMAEVGLSAAARDLPERVGDRAAVTRHVGAGEQRRNKAGVIADGQFTTADARVKLKKLYPTIDE